MLHHKKEDWRTCYNCACAPVCNQINFNCSTHEIKHCPEECKYHIYNANPNRHGDISNILEPVHEWIRIHYPHDAKFLIDHNCAQLLLEHKYFFNDKTIF